MKKFVSRFFLTVAVIWMIGLGRSQATSIDYAFSNDQCSSVQKSTVSLDEIATSIQPTSSDSSIPQIPIMSIALEREEEENEKHSESSVFFVAVCCALMLGYFYRISKSRFRSGRLFQFFTSVRGYILIQVFTI